MLFTYLLCIHMSHIEFAYLPAHHLHNYLYNLHNVLFLWITFLKFQEFPDFLNSKTFLFARVEPRAVCDDTRHRECITEFLTTVIRGEIQICVPGDNTWWIYYIYHQLIIYKQYCYTIAQSTICRLEILFTHQ